MNEGERRDGGETQKSRRTCEQKITHICENCVKPVAKCGRFHKGRFVLCEGGWSLSQLWRREMWLDWLEGPAALNP
ncbi:hypothetical protein Q5P01_021843 [Channa striata]|uniref:Uncharacterized protein n=1 Tax=Channa striata TaxID=64152 RepID=A0AA88LWI0_CHASR|nr:hypothetical protein Q5P01_021843 [Channa striata]